MNSLWEAASKSPFSSPFFTGAQCEAKTGELNNQLVKNRTIAAASTDGDYLIFRRVNFVMAVV